LFDVEFLQEISNKEFVSNYMANLHTFTSLLNENKSVGKKIYIFFAGNKNFLFFYYGFIV
jgi:hypothetical protein